ncbi:pyrroline-5-carboxylate reductase [Candidatus Micrarchaeota archaeon]|nr:pyrroline-5-carboxylate reductase [Candidatus Micrarchaeota archaeon]
MKVAIIGAGRMGEALATGLVASRTVNAKKIVLSDPDKQKLKNLKRRLGIAIANSNKEACRKGNLIILAVKPSYVASVAEEIRRNVTKRIVVSIAAGVRLKRVESILKKSKVIRVMPNTPCLVCEGTVAYSLGKKVNKKDENTFLGIFSGVGKCVRVSERQLNSITGLTGSGPAYIYLIANALIEGGKKQGLNEKLSRKLVTQLMIGASKMLGTCKETPEELIAMVTSPKGTTIEGLKILQRRKVKDALVSAVAAATKRAKELAAQN